MHPMAAPTINQTIFFPMSRFVERMNYSVLLLSFTNTAFFAT
jgi:hypothetical protein